MHVLGLVCADCAAPASGAAPPAAAAAGGLTEKEWYDLEALARGDLRWTYATDPAKLAKLLAVAAHHRAEGERWHRTALIEAKFAYEERARAERAEAENVRLHGIWEQTDRERLRAEAALRATGQAPAGKPFCQMCGRDTPVYCEECYAILATAPGRAQADEAAIIPPPPEDI